MTKKIGFIGCGNMTQALIRAFISSKTLEPAQIFVSDRTPQEKQDFVKEYGINLCSSNLELIDSADVIFLCVKPQDVSELADEIKKELKDSNKIFITIAAGISTKHYTDKIKDIKIIRLMPSMNCEVGEMVSAIYFPENITEQEKAETIKMLDSVGKSFELKEEQFDAFTALSGSGPAFFAYFVDSFAKIAEKYGFDKESAFDMVNMTALGTSKLMKEKNITAEELIKKVMSPKGTTEAGMNVLENSEIKKILEETIAAAVKRAEELGKNE